MSENKYSETKLQEFSSIIKDRLDEVTKQVETLTNIRKSRREGKQDDNPGFGEMSKNEQQASKNKASMRRLKTRQKELKRALLRIENGTYGIDERTGELIDEKRLKALPTATRGI
ncbi:TraR/DksA family transcriptional regulator [Portibacter marinus]|uniref:TraR/DksA family transcriptional regulator n=1 Tax=Portibacter marinus TaxID=2898660 RepID=UPI001F1D65C8|nr:hypothetical protein [Portibacter marinus]